MCPPHCIHFVDGHCELPDSQGASQDGVLSRLPPCLKPRLKFPHRSVHHQHCHVSLTGGGGGGRGEEVGRGEGGRRERGRVDGGRGGGGNCELVWLLLESTELLVRN